MPNSTTRNWATTCARGKLTSFCEASHKNEGLRRLVLGEFDFLLATKHFPAAIRIRLTDSEKLVVYEVATGKWSEVARMPIGYPSWSHDSKYPYFDSGFGSDPAFYRVRISDRKLEELADLKGVRRYWGEFGEWSGLTADDTPLLTRNASSQEVYALDWDHP